MTALTGSAPGTFFQVDDGVVPCEAPVLKRQSLSLASASFASVNHGVVDNPNQYAAGRHHRNQGTGNPVKVKSVASVISKVAIRR